MHSLPQYLEEADAVLAMYHGLDLPVLKYRVLAMQSTSLGFTHYPHTPLTWPLDLPVSVVPMEVAAK